MRCKREPAARLLAVAGVLATAAFVTGCAPQPGVLLAGFGAGPSSTFNAAEGTYHVHWTARDVGATDHGCLIGLAIEQTRAAPAAEPPARWGRASWRPKLVYQSVPAGGQLAGDAVVHFDAGTYLVRAEGSCGWEARILVASTDESMPGRPTPNSLEQNG